MPQTVCPRGDHRSRERDRPAGYDAVTYGTLVDGHGGFESTTVTVGKGLFLAWLRS